MSVGITLQRHYNDLQYIARAMILEISPGEKDDEELFDQKVERMVENILVDMYSKFTDREISNAIAVVKMSLDVFEEEE